MYVFEHMLQACSQLVGCSGAMLVPSLCLVDNSDSY